MPGVGQADNAQSVPCSSFKRLEPACQPVLPAACHGVQHPQPAVRAAPKRLEVARQLVAVQAEILVQPRAARP